MKETMYLGVSVSKLGYIVVDSSITEEGIKVRYNRYKEFALSAREPYEEFDTYVLRLLKMEVIFKPETVWRDIHTSLVSNGFAVEVIDTQRGYPVYKPTDKLITLLKSQRDKNRKLLGKKVK